MGVDDGRRTSGVGAVDQARNTGGVDRSSRHPFRRGELGVHRLEGLPVRIESFEHPIDDGLGQPGQALLVLTAYRPGRDEGRIQVPEQWPGPSQQGLAGDGQLNAVSGAGQQVDSDEPFELADLARQGRLGDEQPFRGPAEVQLLRHGDERAQVPQLDGVRRLRQRQQPAVRIAVLLWPPEAATRSRALAVVTGDRGALAVVGRSIAAGGAVAVLLPSTTPDAARVACGWLADHAAEVGADPLTLTLVTVGLSYDAAAALADSAMDDGWPPPRRTGRPPGPRGEAEPRRLHRGRRRSDIGRTRRVRGGVHGDPAGAVRA